MLVNCLQIRDNKPKCPIIIAFKIMVLLNIGKILCNAFIPIRVNNSKYSIEAKEKYTLAVIICLSLITFLDLLLHMYLAIFSEQTISDKYMFAIITNNVITLIVSLLLLINSLSACKFIKIVYSKAIGNKIASRIIRVTIILILSYELKSLFPLALSLKVIEENM